MTVRILVNSKADPPPGLRQPERLGNLLPHWQIEIRHPADIDAMQAAAAGGDEETVVIPLGGDGSIHAVLPALMDSPAALLPVGAGLANDLARRFGLPRSWEAVADILNSGTRLKQDLFLINGEPCATVGGFGLPTDLLRRMQELRAGRCRRAARHLLGFGAYSVLATAQLAFWPLPIRRLSVHVDGNSPLDLRVPTFGIANQPLVAGRLPVAPGSDPADGILDMVTWCVEGRLRLLLFFLAGAFGGKRRGEVRLPFRRLRIETHDGLPLEPFADGELLPPADELLCEVQPAGLTVHCLTSSDMSF